jgi:hypothetical protein
MIKSRQHSNIFAGAQAQCNAGEPSFNTQSEGSDLRGNAGGDEITIGENKELLVSQGVHAAWRRRTTSATSKRKRLYTS